MKNNLIGIFCFTATHFALAQVNISITKTPQDHNNNPKIFMASNLNNWKANDEKYELKKNAEGLYSINISEETGKVEYKFTQGSWENVEGDINRNPIPNRSFNFTGKPQTIETQILSWQKSQPKKHSLSKNVKILSEHFKIPQLNTHRKIWIYLPDDYDTRKKKYPVIYMEDGQNLFDDATSFSGEWRIDESLDSLKNSRNPQAIIVGIENGGTERLNEYSPWSNPKYGGGKGEAYANFLANTLKPYIDKNYRTLSDAQNTALIGSSMGGLISFYTGLKYPTTFGKLGIFSPSFWFAKNDLINFVKSNSQFLQKTQFYFVAGEKEPKSMITDIKEIIQVLQTQNVKSKQIKTKFTPDGTHSEVFWAKEFPSAYLWLIEK